MAHFETYKPPPDISPSVYKPTQNPLQSCLSPGLISGRLTVIGPWVHRFSKFPLLCFCLFVFCLLVVVIVFFVCFVLFLFFVFCFLCISPSKSNPTSGKIKCVTFCCVTRTVNGLVSFRQEIIVSKFCNEYRSRKDVL